MTEKLTAQIAMGKLGRSWKSVYTCDDKKVSLYMPLLLTILSIEFSGIKNFSSKLS